MGIVNFFKKIGDEIEKQTQKIQIKQKRSNEIRIIKEKYLSQLSQKELIQIYKTYFED